MAAIKLKNTSTVPTRTLEQEVQNKLFEIELASKAQIALREKNKDLFDKYAEHEATKEAAKDAIKRLLFTENGPPAQVPSGQRVWTWAKGEMFCVEVTYKKHSDYYDPAKLKPDLLAKPGVVTEVDRAVVDGFAAKDARIKQALVTGKWMAPSVSIARRKFDI